VPTGTADAHLTKAVVSDSQPTILVAEDDPDIRDLVVFRLQRSGWNVVPAADGEQAMELARQDRPDVAVLDWMMPVKNGMEVIAEMRSDPELATVPILMLSARAQEPDIVQGFTNGATDYLTKPFSPQELHLRVQALLARR
jgi:DNA-binding response OmpR family regulator